MFARVAACQRGATAVEAALVLPILVILVLGIVEFGMLFFSYMAFQSAVREVTREVAVNFADADDVEDLVEERIPGWSRDGFDVTVDESTPGVPATNVFTVVGTLPASSATPLHFFSSGTGDLVTRVTMKQEMPL